MRADRRETGNRERKRQISGINGVDFGIVGAGSGIYTKSKNDQSVNWRKREELLYETN